jgi:hypothetical protein
MGNGGFSPVHFRVARTLRRNDDIACKEIVPPHAIVISGEVRAEALAVAFE